MLSYSRTITSSYISNRNTLATIIITITSGIDNVGDTNPAPNVAETQLLGMTMMVDKPKSLSCPYHDIP